MHQHIKCLMNTSHTAMTSTTITQGTLDKKSPANAKENAQQQWCLKA